MESNWSDDRLDELNTRVDGLGKRMDRGFVEFRTETQTGFDRIERLIEQMDAKFEKRFDRIEGRLGNMEDRLIKVEVHLEDVADRSRGVERRLDGVIYAIIAGAGSTLLAAVGLIATDVLG
jgi:hypothetical protein